jgi:hypothetical protein
MRTICTIFLSLIKVHPCYLVEILSCPPTGILGRALSRIGRCSGEYEEMLKGRLVKHPAFTDGLAHPHLVAAGKFDLAVVLSIPVMHPVCMNLDKHDTGSIHALFEPPIQILGPMLRETGLVSD